MAGSEGRRWGRRDSKGRAPEQESQPQPGEALEGVVLGAGEQGPGGQRPGDQGPGGQRAGEQRAGEQASADQWTPDAEPVPEPVRVDVFTGPESAFFATSSLVFGPTEAVLVDTQLTRAAGSELAEWVAGRTRRLTAVVITHPHPDHYFGTEEILRLFPGTPVYAVPEVIEGIIATGLAKVARWQPVFGDDLTSTPVVPGPLPGGRLWVDGAGLDVLALGQGDCTACSVVHVPGADTVVAGDLVYNGTHLWTAETTPAQRADWLANLELVRGLGASRVVAGHRAPGQGDGAAEVLGFTAGYLREFDLRLAQHPDDAAALVRAMNERYAELTLPGLLELSAEAATARG
ncbi:MBL fold metallo-hydrolase [Streptacidiphilus sp. N1-12]|uniref:MBL fold metallo-hydrolase n=2 Tax=Streptacidiphilus alkalitolerans TaxID=3342712 RepID=A0ABV6V9Z4_9ACTN